MPREVGAVPFMEWATRTVLVVAAAVPMEAGEGGAEVTVEVVVGMAEKAAAVDMVEEAEATDKNFNLPLNTRSWSISIS